MVCAARDRVWAIQLSAFARQDFSRRRVFRALHTTCKLGIVGASETRQHI